MTNNELEMFGRVQEFISQLSAIPKHKITMGSTIEGDLRIYGDDAIELILEYAEQFDVDLKDFNVNKYISPEGDTLLSTIIRILRGKKAKERNDVKVVDLVRGALSKSLNLQ